MLWPLPATSACPICGALPGEVHISVELLRAERDSLRAQLTSAKAELAEIHKLLATPRESE